jgi:hypothetical protein
VAALAALAALALAGPAQNGEVQMVQTFRLRGRGRLVAALLPLWLAACGGGTAEDAPAPPASCSVADQKAWLGTYMNDWYFWYRLSPRPDAALYTSVDSYFAALLYTGTDAAFPADRWSRSESTESFNRFFGDGATLGYGVSVAGLELARDATQPLYVRYVEARSPAASAGIQRGDQVMSINGRSAADVIAADDYAALSAAQAGEALTLVLRRNGGDRSVSLSSAVFDLTPVTGTAVVQTSGGRRLGYVNVKDMISQALAPADAAFSQFKTAGVDDVVLDLRYNGGGLVSTGATLASYVAGQRGTGRRYATLLYNDQRAAANNTTFGFTSLSSSLGLPRVFVLMGRRTCSACEQVINGLRGAGVQVVAIGETSCGKPVGFLPISQCGRTYSVVNFESVNDRNEGRYFNGFDATCAVAERFTAAQGSAIDPLMDAASRFADTGACPIGAGRELPQALRGSGTRSLAVEPGERQGMLGK